jgi:hypothetical protein
MDMMFINCQCDHQWKWLNHCNWFISTGMVRVLKVSSKSERLIICLIIELIVLLVVDN